METNKFLPGTKAERLGLLEPNPSSPVTFREVREATGVEITLNDVVGFYESLPDNSIAGVELPKSPYEAIPVVQQLLLKRILDVHAQGELEETKVIFATEVDFK